MISVELCIVFIDTPLHTFWPFFAVSFIWIYVGIVVNVKPRTHRANPACRILQKSKVVNFCVCEFWHNLEITLHRKKAYNAEDIL